MKLIQRKAIAILTIPFFMIMFLTHVQANTAIHQEGSDQGSDVYTLDASKYVVRTLDLRTPDGTLIGTATGKMDPNVDNVATYVQTIKNTDVGYDTWKAGLPYTNNITCYNIQITSAHGSPYGTKVTDGIFKFTFFVDPKYNGATVYINADGSKDYLTSSVQDGIFSIDVDVSTSPIQSQKKDPYRIAPVTQGAYFMYAMDATKKAEPVTNTIQLPTTKLKISALSSSNTQYSLLKAQMKDMQIIGAYEVAGASTTTMKVTFPVASKYNGKTVIVKNILPEHAFGIVQTVVKDGKVVMPVTNSYTASTAYMIGIPQDVAKRLHLYAAYLVSAGVIILVLLCGWYFTMKKRRTPIDKKR